MGLLSLLQDGPATSKWWFLSNLGVCLATVSSVFLFLSWVKLHFTLILILSDIRMITQTLSCIWTVTYIRHFSTMRMVFLLNNFYIHFQFVLLNIKRKFTIIITNVFHTLYCIIKRSNDDKMLIVCRRNY